MKAYKRPNKRSHSQPELNTQTHTSFPMIIPDSNLELRVWWTRPSETSQFRVVATLRFSTTIPLLSVHNTFRVRFLKRPRAESWVLSILLHLAPHIYNYLYRFRPRFLALSSWINRTESTLQNLWAALKLFPSNCWCISCHFWKTCVKPWKYDMFQEDLEELLKHHPYGETLCGHTLMLARSVVWRACLSRVDPMYIDYLFQITWHPLNWW